MKFIITLVLLSLSLQLSANSWKGIRAKMVKKHAGAPKVKDSSMEMLMKMDIGGKSKS